MVPCCVGLMSGGVGVAGLHGLHGLQAQEFGAVLAELEAAYPARAERPYPTAVLSPSGPSILFMVGEGRGASPLLFMVDCATALAWLAGWLAGGWRLAGR